MEYFCVPAGERRCRYSSVFRENRVQISFEQPDPVLSVTVTM